MKKDWQIKKLGEVCEINIGRTPERGNSKNWDKEKKTNNVWLSIADLNNTENGYISDSTEYVSNEALPKMKLVKANTLLMSFKLTIGRCAITAKDLYTNEAIAALPIKEKDLSLFFLKYYLENFDWDKLTEGDTKVKGKTLNKEKLNVVPIPVPPLAEQERIVKILDQKFAQIDALKQNAEANLNNAKALFQSELEKVFNSNDDWKTIRLKEFSTKIGSGATPKGGKTSYVEEGISLIRSMNVYPFRFEYENLAHITDKQAQELQNVEIKQKDVLFNITGASIARCCVVPDNVLPARVNQHVSILRCKMELLDSDYLCSVMNAPNNQKILLGIGESGSTRQALTKSDLENFIFPLPPLEEQKRIVAHLDSLREKVHQLEEIYTKQLADCDELKQSLLQKAFAGEL